ncbi:recombinase family protein [Streptomyces sp. WAC 06725]|uniref:recombinase family protein n=1 Tax=Streptomyces sp. WAC 06725 TaxID=2203209 RepID=UPI0021ADEA78|nr:recombinase family protein [Streptomyces sp. WAC 06725]
MLTYARPGDTVHISEMFRLVRGTGHILDVLDVLHRDQVALRIHDDAFSPMDLTARHPRTGELLSTVKFMVQTLAAAGELQRDLQRGLTYDGLRAAEAKGSKGGRRPAVATEKTEAVRTAYLEGRAIAALARDHGVSRGAIRTAVAEARATPCASAPSWRYTAGSSPTASPSTALPAPRRPRHSARPIKITPWRLLGSPWLDPDRGRAPQPQGGAGRVGQDGAPAGPTGDRGGGHRRGGLTLRTAMTLDTGVATGVSCALSTP